MQFSYANGRSLAYHEIRLIVATILHRFDLSICAESKSWTDQKIYALWAKPPLMVTVGLPSH
jgi:cytochrome P450